MNSPSLGIRYPDELHAKFATAREELLSTQEMLREAAHAWTSGTPPAEDLPQIYASGIHSLEAYLSRLTNMAEWFYLLAFPQLLGWLDLSPDTPGKLESLRKILFDEVDPVVRQINDASREAWAFTATFRFLALAHDTHARLTRSSATDSGA